LKTKSQDAQLESLVISVKGCANSEPNVVWRLAQGSALETCPRITQSGESPGIGWWRRIGLQISRLPNCSITKS